MRHARGARGEVCRARSGASSPAPRDSGGGGSLACGRTRGFGHVAFNCDDVYEATELLLANGVSFQKKPDEGRMKGLAFALDPDGYWIELVRRSSIFGPSSFPNGNYFNF